MQWFGLKQYFVPGPRNDYRPRLLRRASLLFFLAVILSTEGFLVANLVGRQSSDNFLAAVVPAEIIALTNGERATAQVGALKENKLLTAAAQAKAQDMANKNYFSHKGPDGKTPWQWVSDAGYKYQWAGENLAVRFIDSKNVVSAWMASPTHRANMVKPVYTDIGVGVARGIFDGATATYVVQYFGTPQENAAAVASAPVAQNGLANSLSMTESIVRQVVRVFGEPQSTSNWILGISATLLILALAMTFFVHLHLQHGHMLAQGTVVAALALLLLFLNVHLAPVFAPEVQQSASAVQAAGATAGIVIDAEAESVGYTLFP